jgi:hypothetical protein
MLANILILALAASPLAAAHGKVSVVVRAQPLLEPATLFLGFANTVLDWQCRRQHHRPRHPRRRRPWRRAQQPN